MELQAALASLDTYLEQNRKSVLQALKPGATHPKLARLSNDVLRGEPLPPELQAWFAWHDGQKPGAAELIPGHRFVMLGTEEASRVWTEMAAIKAGGELMEPWELHWVPLFDNGSGDYLVYDCITGRLLEYLHEEPARATIAESLAELCEMIPARMEEEKEAARPRSVRWDLDRSEPLRCATRELLLAAPLGTTLYGGPARLVPRLTSMPPQYLVVVKSHPRVWWAIGRSYESPEACFEQIRSKLEEGGAPLTWGGYDVQAAESWTRDLLKDPDGAASARQTIAEIELR